MDYKELAIMVGIIFMCLIGLRPAVRNFKVVLNDRTNTRATPAVRKFVLAWLGFGVACLVALFFITSYSLFVRIF